MQNIVKQEYKIISKNKRIVHVQGYAGTRNSSNVKLFMNSRPKGRVDVRDQASGRKAISQGNHKFITPALTNRL